VSLNGQYVVFVSDASHLVSTPGNGNTQIYLRDRVGQTTELISKSFTGGLANGGNYQPAISPNGRYVAWRSNASNLVDPITGFVDTNNAGSRAA